MTVPNLNDVIENLTGRKGLRTAKPKTNGFDAYVWRMARFHSGIDPTMPVTCDWDLENYIESFMGKRPKFAAKYYGSTDTEVEAYENYKKTVAEYRKIGDEYADKVCDHFGLNKFAAAYRWGKAFGMI